MFDPQEIRYENNILENGVILKLYDVCRVGILKEIDSYLRHVATVLYLIYF